MKQSEGVFQSGVPSRRRAVVSVGIAFGFCLLVIAPAFAGNFYAGTSPTNVPWPGGIVPYEFTNSLTTTQQVTYLNGLREWELAAKVKFVPHTNQTHWILFAYNTNGFDKVSSSTNPQVVSVASLSRAQVCHEMGHSFGFTHENIRPDATNFIAVLTNNIANEASNIYWFTVDPTSITNGNYDFESVMHLGWDFDSINPGVLPTQQPRPPYFSRYQFRMGNFCLSPGDRAALAYLYGPPAVPLTNVVTTTADVGPGSLRAAIYYATDHPGTTIRFAIPAGDPGYSNGVFNLHLTGMLPPLVTDGTVIDGSTQPGFAGRPLIFVDASQVLPETFTSDTFLIYSANNQIKNISFSGFDWNGLTLIYPGATNNTVSGCWFGLGATGTNAAPNAFQGILIAAGASRNIVGGTNALARNVISGNSQYGVFITDSNTTGNIVLGNYIGTDVGGSMAVPNFFSGVFIGNSASGNIVGSANPAVPNVLSGNTQYGVILTSNTTGNVVLGNYIGTGAAGSFMVSNVMGGVLLADGATRNLIGGTNAGTGNVISGNSGNGILLRGSDVVSNAVQGNFIGTDATGMNPLPNTVAGVTIDTGASFNLIGGAVAGARNVVSGNNLSYDSGVFVADPGTSGNVVEGNYIGLGPDGMTAVPNYYGIICSDGATGNTFGGTVVGARNVISGNSGYGVSVRYPGTSDNVVEGNYIGLDANGVAAVPDDFGVICYGGATNNLIGGTSVGAANFVSGNYYGVCLADPGTSGNFVEGNYIGTDWTGTNGVGNFDNVALQNNATGNFIGGVNAGAGNVIAFATGNGVVLYQSGTTNNSIRGNSIFSNNYLGIDLNGDGVTTNHSGFLAGPNDFQNYPAITNALVAGANTVISGNLNSTPNASFFVDVYRNISPNPSGYGEGQFYVGTVNLTTDVSGNGAFTLTAAGNYAGQNFSATATAADGDTSEFCADQPAVFGPAARFVGPYQSRTNGFTFSLTLQTNFSYRIQATTNLAPPVVWTDLTNFAATDSLFSFTDHFTTNYRVRFYRVVSP